jgi:DNA-binding HxlR family transcriptional regulator
MKEAHYEGLVMDELHDGAKSCSELMKATTLSKHTIRRVCRNLEAKGLVLARVHGRTFFCELTRTRRAA